MTVIHVWINEMILLSAVITNNFSLHHPIFCLYLVLKNCQNSVIFFFPLRKMESYLIISKHTCKPLSKVLVQWNLSLQGLMLFPLAYPFFVCLFFPLHIGRWPLLPDCYLSKPTWPFYLEINLDSTSFLPFLWVQPSLPSHLCGQNVVRPPPLPAVRGCLPSLTLVPGSRPHPSGFTHLLCSFVLYESSQSDLAIVWLDPAFPLLGALRGFPLQVF